MLKSIELHNFKCFNEFTMNSILPVTIIGGSNNTGKSTILEGILTNYAAGNVGIFWTLVNIRNGYMSRPLLPHQVWEPLFCNLKNCNELCINSEWENGVKSKLSISKIYNSGLQHQTKNMLSSIHVNFESPDYNCDGNCIIQRDAMQSNRIIYQSNIDKDIDFEKFTNYFADSLLYKGLPFDTTLPERISGFVLDFEKKNLLIQVLQKFDKNITDIRIVLDNEIPYAYVITKTGNPLPINYMGDGINKALIIVMNLLTLPNGILMIDEVENGFYYEMYEQLLSIFCETALKMNCQLIMTTHNIDIIRAALTSMEKLEQSDKLCFQRIDISSKTGKRNAFPFFDKSLKTAFANNMEIR